MNRRQFPLASSVTVAGTALAGQAPADPQRSFKLKYAPHFSMFKQSAGNDPLDQLNFVADQGFTAWEDSGFKGKPVAQQNKIAKAMEQLGMQMGVFVAHGSIGKLTFARRDIDV